MNTYSIYLIGAAFSVMQISGAFASVEEGELLQSYGDEDFVSIATGRKQSVARAPAVASVISAQSIKNMGARDLDEVLETVPGLHVSARAAGYNPIYTIRGVHSEFNPQVLMLVNGIPVTSLLFGNRGEVWAGMPIQSISRIEIIRGPGSAVYGADAFSGVINIVTKTAQEVTGAELGYSSGSFNESRAWAIFGGEIGGWQTFFSAELLETDGQKESIDFDLQNSFDMLFGSTASLAPGAVALRRKSVDMRLDVSKESWRVRAGYQGRSDGGVGAGAAGALDPIGKGDGHRFNFDVTYRNMNLGKNWEVESNLSYFDASSRTNLILFPSGSFGGAFPEGVVGNPDTFERHTRLNASAFYTGVADHHFRIGVGYQHLDQYEVRESKNFELQITPFGPSPVPLGSVVDVSDTAPFNQEKTRKIYYLSLQDEWKFARDWSLTTGVRFDDYSDFGSTINPRLALVWQTAYNLTTKMLYGRAFRAPSFAEQFNINNPIALGNEDLDPEIVNTYELAFDYRYSESLRLGLNLFHYRMEDIIRFAPTVANNTGDQTGSGVEIEFEWDVSKNLKVLGNYAFQDSEDKDSNSDAPNAPQNQVYLRADYNFASNWHFNTQLNMVMGRARAVGDLRPDVDDYTTLDVTLRAEDVIAGLDLSLSARNLRDEDVFEPSLAPGFIPNDLPLAGRSVFAEVRKSW